MRRVALGTLLAIGVFAGPVLAQPGTAPRQPAVTKTTPGADSVLDAQTTAVSKTLCTSTSQPERTAALAVSSSVAWTATRTPPAWLSSTAARTMAVASSSFWSGRRMNQILTRSGFRASRRRTSARASSDELTRMIGGSSTSSAAGT